MAEFNVGYNGSENFAPDKRFGTFPAASIGWVVSEEKFWNPVKKVINYMKFRVSMGLVGNDKAGNSPSYILLTHILWMMLFLQGVENSDMGTSLE